MSDRPASATLWRPADLLVLFGAAGAGLLLVAAGYWGVSDTRVLDEQVSAARLAAGGVLLAQGGFVWSVVRGRRAIGRRLAAASPGWPPSGRRRRRLRRSRPGSWPRRA